MTSIMITGGWVMMQSGDMGVLVYRTCLHHDIPMLSDLLSLLITGLRYLLNRGIGLLSIVHFRGHDGCSAL